VSIGFPVFAAGTGSLIITGTMPVIERINVTNLNPALNLETGGTYVLANVVEICNRKTGYTVSLSSAGGSKLVMAGATEPVPYTLTYTGHTGTINLSAPVTITDAGAKTPKVGEPKVLSITIPAPDVLFDSGTYTDTLTFTITAK